MSKNNVSNLCKKMMSKNIKKCCPSCSKHCLAQKSQNNFWPACSQTRLGKERGATHKRSANGKCNAKAKAGATFLRNRRKWYCLRWANGLMSRSINVRQRLVAHGRPPRSLRFRLLQRRNCCFIGPCCKVHISNLRDRIRCDAMAFWRNRFCTWANNDGLADSMTAFLRG